MQAREHALDVAVENGVSLAVRLREDRCGGAATDAGQRLQGVDVAWQFAGVLADATLRCGVQVARPRVVAEPGPQRKHAIERRLGETGEIGQCGHKALEIRDHHRDLGLLQHDFRQPDAIGRARMLPGQVVAAIAIEPGYQARSESGDGRDVGVGGTQGVCGVCDGVRCGRRRRIAHGLVRAACRAPRPAA